MAKNKDKKPNEILPDVNISNLNLKTLGTEHIGKRYQSFNCSGNRLKDLSGAPDEVKGNLTCLDNKDTWQNPKPLNQFHLGAGRFEIYGGEEDEDVNRKVKVGGSFITDEQVYKSPKIYDLSVGAPKNKDSKEKSSGSGNPKIILLSNDVHLVVGIKKPILAFDLTGTQEFNDRGQWGYGKWKPDSPVHGFFTPRQKLKDGTGRDKYAGVDDVPPEGWKGWGSPPFNFKNYINWSYFESGEGRGALCESQYRWGKYQPDGATIMNGKNYGAKTSKKCRGTYSKTYYYLKNNPEMKRANSTSLWAGKPGLTLEYESKADFFSNIAYGITGASVIIEDHTVKVGDTYGDKKHPFFGKLDDGTYFAGTGSTPKAYAQTLINYFTKKGKKIEWADIGDGGGSTTLAVDNVMEVGGGRPLAVVIGWE